MIELIFIVVIAGAFVALYLAADRTRVIAVCSVVRGRLVVTRGRLAAPVVSELAEVVRRSRLARATLEVRKEGGLPALKLTGVDDVNTAQQLRNVIGRFQLAQLRG